MRRGAGCVTSMNSSRSPSGSSKQPRALGRHQLLVPRERGGLARARRRPSLRRRARAHAREPAPSPRSTVTSAPRPPSAGQVGERARVRSRPVLTHLHVDLAAARQADVPRVAGRRCRSAAAAARRRRAPPRRSRRPRPRRSRRTSAPDTSPWSSMAIFAPGGGARRALHVDHRRQRDAVTPGGPGVEVLEYVLHDSPSSINVASASSEAIEFPGSRWSTCGKADCIPRVSGS